MKNWKEFSPMNMESKFGGNLYIMSHIFNYLYIAPGLLLFLYLFSGIGIEKNISSISGYQIFLTIFWIVMLCPLLLAAKIQQTKKHKIRITTVDCILFCYGVYILILAINSHYCTIQQWLEYFVLIFIYIYFRNINYRSIYILLFAIFVCTLWQIVYGYQQLSMPWHTISDNKGIFFNTGIFGHLLAVASILTICGIYYSIKYKKKPAILFMVICLILFVIQLVATQSRTSWLALFAGLLVIVFSRFNLRCFFRRFNIYTRAVFILTIFALAVTSMYYLYSIKADSANGRVLIWAVSANIFKENPIIGNGLNSFEANYMNAQALFFTNNSNHYFGMLADDIFVPFNEYLKIGVEQGIIGLLFVLLLIFFLIFKTNMGNRTEAETLLLVAIKSVFIAILVTALFSYPFEILQFKVLAVFLMSVLSGYSSSIKLSERIMLSPAMYKYLKMSISCLLILFLLFVSIQGYIFHTAINKWKTVMKIQSEDYITSINVFKEIYPELKTESAFLVTYSRCLERKGDYVVAIRFLKEVEKIRSSYSVSMFLGELCYKTGDYNMAIYYWNKALNMIPSRFEPLFHIAKLYDEQGDHELARLQAIRFMNKKVKKDSPAFRRMKEYMERILYSDNENLFISSKY